MKNMRYGQFGIKLLALIRNINIIRNTENAKLLYDYEILLKSDHPNIIKVIEKYTYDNSVA